MDPPYVISDYHIIQGIASFFVRALTLDFVCDKLIFERGDFVDQEEICREMETIMRQLSLEEQRYLVELARAAKQAEHYMGESSGASEPDPALTKH